jgi:hypothetical protein
MVVCVVSQRLGEYFYESKLFFKIQTQQTMNTIEKKSLKVGKYVNTEHVDNLIRNYKKDRWIQNSENLGKQDTLGVWFSAEELEEFIQTARMHGADGIRICFGVYGANAPRKGTEGCQTVALVATSSNEESFIGDDVYVENNGKAGLLAYNTAFPLWPITPTVTTPTTTTILKANEVGTMMTAGKDGLMII